VTAFGVPTVALSQPTSTPAPEPCAQTCAEALASGTTVCPDAGGTHEADYNELRQCADTSCLTECMPDLDDGQPVGDACNTCLQMSCSSELGACKSQ
jgi:hypothetical protein